MSGIETNRSSHPGLAMPREAVTAAAAIGFLAGGGARMLADLGDMQQILASALLLPLGAITAAVVTGILMNLFALPALSWVLPGRRLPIGAYRVAGALSGLAAFAGAFVQFSPVAA